MTASPDVLIVDDDDDLRETFVMTLEDEGIHVASVKNGREALEQLRAGMKPAVILLDFAMPVMDAPAFRAAQRADAAIAAVPVVLMSASRRFHIEGEPELPHITKPLSLETLVEVVRRYAGG